MRNVNELIGIVKGISFDEVINQSEVTRLKNWLEENRVLVSNQSDMELVSLIDSILEDNVITLDEKNSLLQYANSINTEGTAETNALYELKGILDGIVCDNELNEDEIRRLQKWLNNRPDALENDETSQSILHKVNEILEDNIVTDEEQKELIKVLQNKIKDLSYETKIMELRRMVREKQNIGLKILDVLSDHDVVANIHEIAQQQLSQAINSYNLDSNKDYSMIFISLCIIALRHYDGNFYEHVRSAYRPLYVRYSEQKIEGMIRTILNKYQYHVDENGETRVINSVLYNTIVPRLFLESFFEFIYDIYQLNFDYSIPEDIKSEFDFVYDGLRKEMLSNDDSLTVNVTRKSYKLIQTTKRLILNAKYKDLVTSFSTMILSLIDNRIMTGEAQYVQNPYIAYGYKAWLSTLDSTERGQRRRTNNLTESKRVARFVYEEGQVSLITPVYHVTSDVDYSRVQIVIVNGDKELYYNDYPQIKDIIGGYEIASEKMYIDDPLGQLKCMLMEGDTILKSTESSLYRDVLVFDESGKEIKNNTDYNGTAIICGASDSLKDEVPFYRSENYDIYAKSVDVGDVFRVNDSVFAFSSYVKPELLGIVRPNQFLKEEESGQYLPVYSQIDCLAFESTADSDNLNIEVNNHTYLLNELEFTVKPHINSKVYSVKLPITESDIYTVAVYESDGFSKTQIYKTVVGLDLYCSTDTTRISDTRFVVNIDSDLCSTQATNDFEIADYEVDWLKYMNRGKQYSYILPVDLELFRIQGNSWMSFEDGLWIGDIEHDSVLEILKYDVDSICVRSEKGEALDEEIIPMDCLTHKEIRIGFLKSYAADNAFVSLWMMRAGKVTGVLYCYYKCIMDMENTSVEFDDLRGVLNVYPVFHGRGRVRLEITDRLGNEECSSDEVESGQILQVEGLDSFTDYTITLYELVRGFTIKNKKQKLHSWQRKLFAIKDFNGMFFRINHVVYEDYRGTEMTRREYKFRNSYVHMIKQVSNDKFKANMVIRIKDKYYKLKGINPVDVELCSGVIDGEIELMVTNEGDGLLIDFEHQRVLGSLDGDTPDIYSYYIDVNGARK